MAAFVKIAQVGDVPEGSGRLVEARGRSIALFHVEGEFYALDNRCSHRGGPLADGFLEGKTIACPWHGWQFDLTTGASPVNPHARQTTYPVKVEGEDLLVALED